MATLTLSSKNQVTIPAEMVRTLQLKAGDKLAAELIDDHIVLLPEPESWTDYFRGSMKGVYGSTKEEIDRYIAEERYGYHDGALTDARSLDPELNAVYEATSLIPARASSEVAEQAGVSDQTAMQKLADLEDMGIVKRMEHATLKAQAYWRRIR